MARVESQSGGDPTKTIVQTFEANQKELAQDFINLWFQESQEWLYDAAQRRSELGKQHGVEGRAQNGLHKVADEAVPPMWNQSEERWEFSYPHEGAVFQEFGAQPHEIRAREAERLAFGWPDAPKEIKEEFAETEGDLVFFEKVNHPGIPAIGFLRYGRERAKRRMERSGIDPEAFGGSR